MPNRECEIVQDLLPQYIEGLVGEKTKDFVAGHLATCDKCREVHMKMMQELSVNTTVSTEGEKGIIRYLCMVALWYMLCPLGAVLLLVMGGGQCIKYYEAVIGVFGVCCVISEVFRYGTWWDTDWVQYQANIHRETKKKRGKYYVRPVLIALPALLTVAVLNIPNALNYIRMLI